MSKAAPATFEAIKLMLKVIKTSMLSCESTNAAALATASNM